MMFFSTLVSVIVDIMVHKPSKVPCNASPSLPPPSGYLNHSAVPRTISEYKRETSAFSSGRISHPSSSSATRRPSISTTSNISPSVITGGHTRRRRVRVLAGCAIASNMAPDVCVACSSADLTCSSSVSYAESESESSSRWWRWWPSAAAVVVVVIVVRMSVARMCKAPTLR